MNLYCILDGDPLNYVDTLGLAKVVKPLPESATKCCTAQKISDGEKTLNANFQKAKAAAKAKGITPAPGGGAGATCKNSSQDIIDWLAPFPPCWRCHLEERNYYSPKDDPNDTCWDHQVIICTAYLPGSVKSKEIIFDWWGDVHYWYKSDVSGGPPTAFREAYKYPGKIQNPASYTNCDGTRASKGRLQKPCFSCSMGGPQ